jgi:HlyD family secretion protein
MGAISKLLLPLALLLSVAAVFMLTQSFEKNTTQFFGLTEDHEQAVSFQEPVEITEIAVIEGQYVEQGSVLLRAKRSELDGQKILLNSQIDELNARQGESAATIRAQIRVLQAKKSAELAKIDMQIQQLQSKRRLNVDLYKKITGNSLDTLATDGVDPMVEQENLLRQQKQYLANSIQAQINALRTQLSASKKPISVKKHQVEDRLAELNRQAQELIVRADFTGRIGSINFKQGERVPAFKGVMTVHGLYPEYVKGYIHENVSNDAKIGQRVWVYASRNHKQAPVSGVIESLGSRIVEYPDRLKVNPQVRSWGREVNIRLEKNNPLLLGEKVQISFTPQRPNSAEAFFKPFGEKAEGMLPNAFAEERGE